MVVTHYCCLSSVVDYDSTLHVTYHHVPHIYVTYTYAFTTSCRALVTPTRYLRSRFDCVVVTIWTAWNHYVGVTLRSDLPFTLPTFDSTFPVLHGTTLRC